MNGKLVNAVQGMYENSRTSMRFAVRTTEWFSAEVGLHQGSALSPLRFAMIMDIMIDGIGQESSWSVLFADDIVKCGDTERGLKITSNGGMKFH